MNRDIGELKSLWLESMARFEECRMMNARNTDPNYEAMLRERPIDPVRNEKLRGIHTHCLYIDTEIQKIDTALDEEWDTYIKRKNNTKYWCCCLSLLCYYSFCFESE